MEPSDASGNMYLAPGKKRARAHLLIKVERVAPSIVVERNVVALSRAIRRLKFALTIGLIPRKNERRVGRLLRTNRVRDLIGRVGICPQAQSEGSRRPSEAIRVGIVCSCG